MIIDRIENWDLYFSKKSALYAGIDFISNFHEAMADGRYEIKGQDIYAIVQSYDTQHAANRKIESHRKYIDIQYCLSGREVIGWLPVAGLRELSPYSDEKDVIFYQPADTITPAVMLPGTFAIFFPMDAHQPGCVFQNVEPVRKIVVKIACHLPDSMLHFGYEQNAHPH